ncbi:hypothetical protein EG329_013031 [Mollisiaceae sp. DMI_Dod_QoI]|nr:hypothetical protein EG329_013031 [Helotiales sp. DMI_Dod_QoI]
MERIIFQSQGAEAEVGVSLPVAAHDSSQRQVFSYHDLNQDHNEIRLLRILESVPVLSNGTPPQSTLVCCEIFHANLNEAASYNTLSYTWGPPSAPQISILLNGNQFLVRENLWMALKRLKSVDAGMIIWIDAICINQESIQERNSQVPMMTQIYKQADQVLAWLGPSYEDSTLAFQVVQDLGQPDVAQDWAVQQLKSRTAQLQALSRLFQREYWMRMWVLQELTVAKSIMLYCGDDSISGDALVRVQELLVRIRNSGMTYNDLLQAMDNDVFGMDVVGDEGLLKIQEWNASASKQDLSFCECLMLHADRSATDPRDLIYGLANIANEKSKYHVSVDYALSVRELYISFAKTEIQTSKTLFILTRARPIQNQYALPSWVPDWSTIKSNHVFLNDARQPQHYFKASGDSQPEVSFDSTGEHLTMKVVVLGCINVLGVQTGMASDRDLKQCLLGFAGWWSLIKSHDSSQHESFARTILLRKPEMIHNANGLLDILGMFGDYLAESHPDEPADETLLEYWQRFVSASMNRRVGLMGRSYDRKIKDLDRDKQVVRSWRRIFAGYCWDRRFFLGSDGRMGLAPSDAREEDLLCVPFGCPCPMILRKVGTQYVVVGEAYVDGLMYGEAINLADRGELKVEELMLF